MTRTPPLLRKMTELRVGELVVRRDRIIEPRTGFRVAHGFPSETKAIDAAREMNEVADWFGILKTRAEGGRPNCQSELERIAEAHGGKLADGNPASDARCREIVRQVESP